MKKLFNYALLAAALLIGVNVNAQTPVCELTMNGSTKQLTSLYDAFDAVTTAALDKSRGIAPEAYIDHETDFYEAVDLADSTVATIKLLANATLDAGRYAHIDGFKYVLNAGERITIDLNGKTLTSNVRFNIFEASLYFVNTNAQVATINTDNNKVSQFLNAYGSRDKDAAYGFCRIVLGKNIVFNNPEGYGMCFFPNDYYFAKFKGTPYAKKHGPGAGTTIDIYGEIRCLCYCISGNGQLNVTEGNIPIITLHEGAKLIATGSPCIYAPAYAIYNIHGYVEGASGIYIKTGEVNIDGATIVATSTNHTEIVPNGNGTSGGEGTAIVVDSHSSYGSIGEINIANSTIISNASDGYAIEELVTQGSEKLPDIIVESGTFVGGITTTEEERSKIVNEGTIQGGEWHNSDINQYLDDNHTTIVYTDKDGKQYQVVVPIGADDWKQSIEAASKEDEGAKYAKVAENETVSSNTTVEFVRIEEHTTVTVGNGATLDAGTLMLEGDAQIVVKAGATLIVSGEQGAYTFDEKSIIIETNEEDHGQFLINPAVALNTTPKATVRINSDAFKDDKNTNHVQLFGNPMISVDEISAYQVKDDEPATSAIYFDLWKNSQWNYIGGFNADKALEIDKLNEPFGLFCITSKNDQENLLYYIMKGNLVGNSQPTNFSLNYGWTSAANSWTGDMGGRALIDALTELNDNGASEVSLNAYLPHIIGTTIAWDAYGEGQLMEGEFRVSPMQPMMFDNEEARIIPTDIMSYTNLVWNSREGAPAKAPRQTNNDIQKAEIVITSAEGFYDRAVIAETQEFSDPRYSARKYMNDELCVYISADKNYDTYMAENVENTLVSFNCKNAGKYTVSFENVTGNFDLIDLTNNARINMVVGATYEFLAEAGENANRFMVVEGAKAPTNNEKVKGAVKAMKVISGGEFRIVKENRAFNAMGAEL